MKNKRIELILEEVKDSDSVLDVGCAAGDHAEGGVNLHQLLCEKARRVVGIDTAVPGIPGQTRIIRADAESMKLNEKFDLIIAGRNRINANYPPRFLTK